jgi:hypothetical protein
VVYYTDDGGLTWQEQYSSELAWIIHEQKIKTKKAEIEIWIKDSQLED